MEQNKNKTSPKRNWFGLNVTLFILLITSFLARLVFANMAASQSYELSQYSRDLQQLNQQQEQLNLAATELQSLERVKNDSARLNLVKVDRILYLEPTGAVAINR